VLDGLKLERAGVPAASIVTEPFIGSGRTMASVWGVPDYKFLVTSHPIGNLKDDQLNRMADELAEQVIDFLQNQ